VLAAYAAASARKIAALDARAQPLYIVAGERRRIDDHLEAVIVGRVVAARDHDAAAGLEMLRGEIGHWRDDHADVNHIDARGANPFAQRRNELGTRKTTVAPDGDRVALAFG